MLRLTDAVKRTAPSGQVIVIGFIHPEDLPNLLIDTYQREQLPVRSAEEWRRAFQAGEVPPIDLGSRNTRLTKTANGYTIGGDQIYVVDGRQRKTVAEMVYAQGGEVCLPVLAYLGTTREWEIERFRRLNADRTRVSTNVLLHNAESYNAAIAQLVQATTNRGNELSGRVQWTQTPKQGNLLTAVTLVRVAATLHTHHGRGLLDTNMAKVSGALEDVTASISLSTFQRNLDTFFELVGAACDIGQLESARNVTHLRMGYLLSLATLFANHDDFWQDSLLVIPDKIREMLIGYKFDEIERSEIASRGRAVPSLVNRFADKCRSARRKALTPW